MPRHFLRALRLALDAARLGALAIVLAVVGGTHAAPLFGIEPVVILGASMEPKIPLGSLVLLQERDPELVQVGDVITRRSATGVLVTHRVVDAAEINGVPHFATRGDASASVDPVLAGASEIEGAVVAHLPLAGYVVTMLSRLDGILSVVAAVVALTIAASLLEDRERRQPLRRSAAGNAPA